MKKLQKIAPETSKIKRDQPFRVPDNYFGDFSARLHSRLYEEAEILPHKKIGVLRYLKPVLGLAASFALVFMLVYWPVSSFLPGYLARTQMPIEQEIEIDTYMPSLERLDENSFFTLITEIFTGTEEGAEEFNDEELLNYLSANVSDYELFMHTEN